MVIDGLSTRLTAGGIAVMRVHYRADPHRRSEEWIAGAERAYPGGRNSPRWRKEQEIEWGALGGMRLFPEWERWQSNGKIVIAPFEPVGYRLYGSYDHGWRNPACYLVHGVGSDGQIVTLWEVYGDHIGVPHMARIIKGEAVSTPDGRRFEGNPYAGKEILKVADPSMWAEDQPMADGTNKSVAMLFGRNGVYFQKGERGGDTMVAEWLHGHFWKDPQAPLYRITSACPKLVWEIGQQRHKEISARVALNKDQPETLVDKDNHAFDCYDPETEILTESGWSRFSDLPVGEKVATLVDGRLVYEAPRAFVVKYHKGPMLRYAKGALDFLVTPTHRFYASSFWKKRQFELVPASELQAVMLVPRNAEWTGETQPSPIEGVAAEDVLAWLGFWLAEGCKSTNHRGSLYAHVDQTNPDAELLALMERIGCGFKYVSKAGCTRFTLGARWYRLVADQGLSYEKFVPAWVKRATREQIRIFLHWIWKGDGTDSETMKRYATTSERLADDVQELVLKAGGVSTVNAQPVRMAVLPNGRSVQGRPVFYVTWNRGRHGQGGKGDPSTIAQIHRSAIEEVPYDGRVYCVTTSSGVIYVRRNGKPMWCGNSLKMFLKKFPPKAPTEQQKKAPNTFSWWRELAKHGEKSVQRGSASFRV